MDRLVRFARKLLHYRTFSLATKEWHGDGWRIRGSDAAVSYRRLTFNSFLTKVEFEVAPFLNNLSKSNL